MRNRNQLRCNHNKKYTKDGTTNSSTQQKASKGKIDSLRISCCLFLLSFRSWIGSPVKFGEKKRSALSIDYGGRVARKANTDHDGRSLRRMPLRNHRGRRGQLPGARKTCACARTKNPRRDVDSIKETTIPVD